MSAYTKLEDLLIQYDETYRKLVESSRNEGSESSHTNTEFLWGDIHSLQNEVSSLLLANRRTGLDILRQFLKEHCPNTYEEIKDLSDKQFTKAMPKLKTKTKDNFYFINYN